MESESVFGIEPEQLNELLSVGEDDVDDSPDESEPSSNDRPLEEKPDTEPAVNAFVEQPGSWIGPYKLLRVLGEGGMGIAYLAEQKRPMRRKVAIKVIKPGMDSRRVVSRFEAERQALALLDHPNIAHVHDAGTTELGRPYFVMEYVKGLSITDYCDHHKLTIKDRLVLFQQICHAIQHAHQKGIIHRDIKPSNILVSVENDQPTPKIIDFGVAKAIGRPLTDRTVFTEDSHLLGTPEYMSPEQADMATEDIDTRSDVYSLGVLLYVLLTGVLPFDVHSLRDSGIEKIRRTIRETDPKTPSTRLVKLGQEATVIAQNRGTKINTLAKHLRKELEWIPLKAMRKERSERYRSASELADDIENYLNGSPLIAGPPTAIYRFKKFIKRHAGLSAAVLAVVVTLLLGLAATLIMYFRLERQARVSETVSRILRKDLIASVSPTVAMGREVTVRSLLDNMGKKLDTKLKDEPLVQASIRDTLGNTYRHLGDFKAAEMHLERACELHEDQLGLEEKRTLSSMSGLIWVYFSQGSYFKAQQLADKALGTSRRMYREGDKELVGPTNAVAFAYMKTGWYQEAESLYLKLLEDYRRLYGEGYGPAFGVLHNLARVYSKQGRYKDAEQLYNKVLPTNRRQRGEEHPYTLISMAILARVYAGQGRYGEAERLCRKVLEVEHRVLGEEHLYTLECMSELGCVHIAQKKYHEAESLFDKALEIARRRLREGHPLTLRFVNGLAVIHTHLKHFIEAEILFDEALKSRIRELGEDHPETLETINDIGVLRREQKKYEEAESLLRQALTGRQQKLGSDHFSCFETMHELGVLYKEQELYDKAEPLFRDAIYGRRDKLGNTHPHTQESIKTLIDLYEAWEKPEEAQKWQAKVLADGYTNGQSQNASGR
jgi:serine/threonine protein kinase